MRERSAQARPRLRWLPALAVMAGIFVLSSISGLRISDDAEVDSPFRVVAHLAVYAVLAGLLLYAVTAPGRPALRGAAVAITIALLYALTDELHQAFVPNRSGQVDDLVVDGLGALAGVAMAWALLSRRSRASRSDS